MCRFQQYDPEGNIARLLRAGYIRVRLTSVYISVLSVNQCFGSALVYYRSVSSILVNADPDPDRGPGFDDKKIKNKLTAEKKICFDQNLQFTYL